MHTISTCPQCGQEMRPTDYHARLQAILLDSPSERLRRICDDLEKYKNNSPYSAGAWDELLEEKIRAKAEIDRLRAVNADLMSALIDARNGYQQLFDVMPVAWQTYATIIDTAIAKGAA